MTSWLTIEAAAKRVERSPDTIYRWARQGLLAIVGGHVLEGQLLAADRTKRLARRGPTRQKGNA